MKEFCGLLLLLTVLEIHGSVLQTAPKDTPFCIHGNTTYAARAKFKSNDCTTCHCPRNGGRVQCAIMDCRRESNCLQYKKIKGECCSKCEKYRCEHRKHMYKSGQRWYWNMGKTNDPCERVRCECLDHGRLRCQRDIPRHQCRKQRVHRCFLHGKPIAADKVVRLGRGKCIECRCPKLTRTTKRVHAICRKTCK